MNYELESRLSQLLCIFVEVLPALKVLVNTLNDVAQPVHDKEREGVIMVFLHDYREQIDFNISYITQIVTDSNT